MLYIMIDGKERRFKNFTQIVAYLANCEENDFYKMIKYKAGVRRRAKIFNRTDLNAMNDKDFILGLYYLGVIKNVEKRVL